VGRIVDVHRGPIQKGGQGLPEKRSLGNYAPSPTVGQLVRYWDVLTDATSYIIYWGTTSGVYPNSQDVGNVTSYDLSVLSPALSSGTTYYFVVRGSDGSGESDASSELTVTP
jgi:hypothetical protein